MLRPHPTTTTSLCALALQISMSVSMKPSVAATASARTQTALSAAIVTRATPTHRGIRPNVSVCNCSPLNVHCAPLLPNKSTILINLQYFLHFCIILNEHAHFIIF